jgi:hypothetical protein
MIDFDTKTQIEADYPGIEEDPIPKKPKSHSHAL